MKELTYTIRDACGIHARPAGQLVKLARGCASSVTLQRGGDSCDVKRLMNLMGMGIRQGDEITVRAEGADEEACIAAIGQFLRENV